MVFYTTIVEHIATDLGTPFDLFLSVIIELNKFPESFSFLFGEDLNDTSLFEVLKKHNIILDHSRKTLDIIFASPQEAKALNINKGYPLLRIKSTIHDVENTITNLCQQLCIGDKFTFIV